MFEIKTARLGKKHNNFQFNGINPNYNYDYLICVGITKTDVYYRIVSKKIDFQYIHEKKKRGYWVNIMNSLKKIVEMNPDNKVNHKLTLPLKLMNNFVDFETEIKKILDIK
ncbi:hypothetical protein [Ureaplasma canigenitalium]|uniref:hypothetical protein n=1 Tax=Ureaplasma canigenitalium TaxID=42092 RepID=UPI00068CBDB0|nr:hypothetical protein [Ureaplasma canigenitalium]